jgi:4-oxalocrotonate tautomerase
MPIAHIYLLEGRTKEQKAEAIAAVTEALSQTLDSPQDRIRVLLHETSPDHWGIAGVPASAQRAAPKP